MQRSTTTTTTTTYKIEVIDKWLRGHGASAANPATVGIGISLDEWQRVNTRRAMPYERPDYPLLDHVPPLRRTDCQRIIAAAGLPVPPKSACWFCRLRRPDSWAATRRDRPDLFAKACALEDLVNARRAVLGKDPVWLTRFNKPLTQAIGEAQDMLPGLTDEHHHERDDEQDYACDNGACFT